MKILKCRKQPLDSKNASGDQKAFLKQKTKKEMACEDAGIRSYMDNIILCMKQPNKVLNIAHVTVTF